MRFWHAAYVLVNCALFYELQNNPEHMQHADADEACWVFRLLTSNVFVVLGWLLYRRQQYYADAAPLRRNQPRPAPPPLALRGVPRERYMFIATNDENVDLQPRGRDRG